VTAALRRNDRRLLGGMQKTDLAFMFLSRF
jgi:hypothetical protein